MAELWRRLLSLRFAKRNMSQMGSQMGCLPFASRVALVLGASISIDMHGAHTTVN